MLDTALVILAYLLGSVPTGYILGRLSGVDVRRAGSGNVGATNVARIIGRGHGAITLIGDAAKGWLPAFAAQQLELGLLVVILAGTAAFLGHLYPIFLHFRGGKGVATALGVFLALAPLATSFLLVIFAGATSVSRIVSVGSMAAAVAAPVILWLAGYPYSVTGMGGFLGAMIVLRHRDNIQRLFAGTEPRFKLFSSR